MNRSEALDLLRRLETRTQKLTKAIALAQGAVRFSDTNTPDVIQDLKVLLRDVSIIYPELKNILNMTRKST